LIEIANGRGYATMVAGIDAGNEISKVMHRRVGFRECGTIRRAGFKFGKWLDLALYQYELRGPETPSDG
jgi:phosphinothricin acetyltransferase